VEKRTLIFFRGPYKKRHCCDFMSPAIGSKSRLSVSVLVANPKFQRTLYGIDNLDPSVRFDAKGIKSILI
jgi:hypothetical protein